MSTNAATRRASAAKILTNTKIAKERDRWLALWNFLIRTELAAGTTFIRSIPEGHLYAVLGDSHRVVSLPRRGGDAWHAYFHTTYGFVESEKVSRFIYDAIRSYAYERGDRVELHRFAYFDAKTKTAYLSTYDGYLYRASGRDQIDVVPQGTDGVYFADDDEGVATQPELSPHNILLDRLANPSFAESPASGITPEQQRMAFVIWMFAVAFPDLLPAKPILLLEGLHGSGKTSSIVLLQILIRGVKKPLILREDDEKDFGVILLRNPIALLDNLDSFVPWLPNALCAYATSGSWTKRKLYTDDESVTIRPQSFVVATSRNPSTFKREDVADRALILRFDRRKGFVDPALLESAISAERPKLFGEYLWYVNKIVAALRSGADVVGGGQEAYRMAGFVAFARVVGRVLGWDPGAITDLMMALQNERHAFLNEEDPLIELLTEWLRFSYNPRAAANSGVRSNRGRLIDVFDLHKELEMFASQRAIKWIESPRTLGQKLRGVGVESEFVVEQHTLNKRKAFRLWFKSDPRLEVVEG